MKVFDGPDEVLAAVGTELGVGDWLTVTQPEVNTFADVTGDHQWIHVDPERAKDSPFGSTVVHGFFTLSLLPRMLAEVFEFKGFAYGVNYGLNRVRFPAPFPVGARVRVRVTLSAVEPVPGGLQATTTCTVEREGGSKPVCVADLLSRMYVAAS
jgi:acyl dehydratase